MKQKLKKFLKELRFYTLLFIVAITLAIGMRVFLFTSIIKIPSDSMEPAVLAGDFIIANKQIPSPVFTKTFDKSELTGRSGRNDSKVFVKSAEMMFWFSIFRIPTDGIRLIWT